MFASSKTTAASSGYQISRSLRFNSADGAYLSRTPASSSNRKTWTWSGWIKLTKNTSQQYFFGGTQDSYNVLWTLCSFYQNKIYLQSYSGGFQFNFETTQVFRDYSAWYHIVVAVDTTQATDTNRLKLYVNGNLVTSYVTASYPSQNTDTLINGNWLQTISGSIATTYLDGYITEVNFIDGQQLTPSSFGETNAQTGVWQPKAYSGSYGTNGFYLNFSDNSNTTAATLGKDYSGNGNNWTPNNFSVTAGAGNDSMVDTPTNYGVDSGVGGEVRGNYCTLNPLNLGASASLSNGNLDSLASSSVYSSAKSTMGVSSGKWYIEGRLNVGGYHAIGVSNSSAVLSSYIGSTTDSWGYWAQNGNKVTNASFTSYGATYTAGDIIGVALDMDAGTVVFYKNGTSQGTAFTGLTGTMFIGVTGDGSGAGSWSMNFGQRPFAYTAPSGYKALCTQNLPTPAVGATAATQAGKFFGATLRNGGAGTYTTTVDMSNGALLWNKPRNQASSNYLVDSNRGLTKQLVSDATNAEATQADWLTSFGNGSYTTGSTDWGSGVTMVDWLWAAGANTTNTAGTITSTVSANTTSGFSMVTWTGTGTAASIGHGLGVAPKMVITKNRDSAWNWYTYHAGAGANYYLQLNLASAAGLDTAVWQNTAPTSSVFTIGAGIQANGAKFVAYCFAEIAGYSKFGSYTGNSSTDGPFIYCGFRPKYVMIKLSSGGLGDWIIYDAARNTYNVENSALYADLSNAEATVTGMDFLSNGFKLRGTSSDLNGGYTYIFAAFAEAPFNYSLAR